VNPRKKKRIEELLRRELSTIILYELKDPRAGFVTVTGVQLGDDSRSAKVRVMARGPDDRVEIALAALAHARGFMQSLIGKRLDLRYTPLLQFERDKETERLIQVDKLIDQARREDQKA